MANNPRDVEKDDVKMVMSTEYGRRFMHRLLVRAGIYALSYVPEADSHHTSFREGQRNMGLWALAELEEACPESYFTMLKENRKD